MKKSHNRNSPIRSGLVALTASLSGVYLLNRLNIVRAAYIYDSIHKILIASIVISYFIACLLFIKGSETRLMKQIHPLIAFFYGVEINLTLADIDLQFFFEFRVGLIGWACLNLCFLLRTMDLYTHRRPPAFVLVFCQQIFQAFQLIWHEDTDFQNNKVKKDPIGFLRVFSCLCWFPFLW